MRLFISLLASAFIISWCIPIKHDTLKETLDGTWMPVRQEFEGKQMPSTSLENERLILADSSYTFIAESTDKGVISYAVGKMDIYGREGVNKDKHFTAKYKLENEVLTICYNLKGDSYPESFETKDHKMFFLCEFKKMDGK